MNDIETQIMLDALAVVKIASDTIDDIVGARVMTFLKSKGEGGASEDEIAQAVDRHEFEKLSVLESADRIALLRNRIVECKDKLIEG